MTKPVIQLHTIEQWLQLDKSIQPIILQHIRLKDRLYKYLKKTHDDKKAHVPADGWMTCKRCEGAGKVKLEPRLPGIHPSQLPHPCMLKVYNEMIGKPGQEKIEARSLLIFEVGHYVHDMFQTYGKAGAWGPIYDSEVRLSKDYQELSEILMLEGHADAENVLLIDDIPNSPYDYEVGIVHEYKTINLNGFEKLTRPKPEHKVQAMVYAAALNRPIVVYLYMNKNDQNLVDFPVAFEQDLWVSIEAKARVLKEHYEKKVPPQASPGFHCQYCAYVFDCDAYKSKMTMKFTKG